MKKMWHIVSETVLLLCFSIFIGVFSWQVEKTTCMIRTYFFLAFSLSLLRQKEV